MSLIPRKPSKKSKCRSNLELRRHFQSTCTLIQSHGPGSSPASLPLQVQDKDLLVSPHTCSTPECTAGSAAACSLAQCELCRSQNLDTSCSFSTEKSCSFNTVPGRQCLTEADLTALRRAWLERKNQFATTRIFPPPVSRKGDLLAGLEGSNRKMASWYKGKCLMDASWCDI